MKKLLFRNHELKICVIGLGYVGLPLAIEFGKKIPTIGFDINKKRISNLSQKVDKNKEISKEEFVLSSKLKFSNNLKEISNANFYIVCVPTPVTKSKIPDLKLLKSACLILSKVIKKNDFIVFESTVYPGTTEEICIPLIKKYFLKKKKIKLSENYFNFGYSPERINPGDKKNILRNVSKIVSGYDKTSLDFISKVYSLVTKKIFKAKSIKIAESAKIIENCQRDINIAFMNELAIIFNKLNIDFKEVLNAASTKWNFLNFKPGLVGGHCIGIDPYYLAYKSKQMDHNPEIILSGRKINDGMAKFYYKKIAYNLKKKFNKKNIKLLILGASFKENVSDLRNSKALEVVEFLKKDFKVHIYDHIISKQHLDQKFLVHYISKPVKNYYDCLILLVPHNLFASLKFQKSARRYLKKEHLIFDIKQTLNKKIFKSRLIRF